MARDAGAKKVYFASAAPAVRFPNVYGIDMPTRTELLATGRTEEEIAREIGADSVIYQDLDALEDAVRSANPELRDFETSCFNGEYITGDITEAYLDAIERARRDGRSLKEEIEGVQPVDLNLNGQAEPDLSQVENAPLEGRPREGLAHAVILTGVA